MWGKRTPCCRSKNQTPCQWQDINIHIQLYEQHFLFLERNCSKRKRCIKKSLRFPRVIYRHLGILQPAAQTPFINVWCRKNSELLSAPPRSQHCTRFMLAVTSALRCLSGANSPKKWDHGSAPLQPKQVHFTKAGPVIRNASTVQARIPKLLRTANWHQHRAISEIFQLNPGLAKFQASAAQRMWTALFWVSTQGVVIIPYRRFGNDLGFLNPEDGTR